MCLRHKHLAERINGDTCCHQILSSRCPKPGKPSRTSPCWRATRRHPPVNGPRDTARTPRFDATSDGEAGEAEKTDSAMQGNSPGSTKAHVDRSPAVKTCWPYASASAPCCSVLMLLLPCLYGCGWRPSPDRVWAPGAGRPRRGGRGAHHAPAGARRGDDVDQDDDASRPVPPRRSGPDRPPSRPGAATGATAQLMAGRERGDAVMTMPITPSASRSWIVAPPAPGTVSRPGTAGSRPRHRASAVRLAAPGPPRRPRRR